MQGKRFIQNKHRILSKLLKIRFTFISVFLILLFYVLSLSQLEKDNYNKQYAVLDNAIKRTIVHCYSVEGTYPPSIEYMKDHYGLTYNEHLFFIDYHAIGSNIYPEFEIIPINEQ